MTRRRKKKKMKFVDIFLLIIIIFVMCSLFIKKDDNNISNSYNAFLDLQKAAEEANVKIQYDLCMSNSIETEKLGNIFKETASDTINYLAKYEVFVSYEELDSNYYFGYRDNEAIYGASLIKLVDALYVLDNNIDVSETIKYSSNYYNKYNKGLKNHSLNEDVSIQNIVNYALSLSDNGAHNMLIDYIGFQNLKSYGENLGAKVILQGGDKFGNQTASDTTIYLKRLYILYKQNEMAKQFSNYMINDFHSYLSINNLEVSHKYGFYEDKFHDIGIIYDEHPYTLSVLTKYGKGDYKSVINNISVKINQLHNQYWLSKGEYCQNK